MPSWHYLTRRSMVPMRPSSAWRYTRTTAGAAEDLPETLARMALAESGLRPMRIFAHAPIEREAELRAAYRRVYVCHQLVRPLQD